MTNNHNESVMQSPVSRRCFVKAVGVTSGVASITGCIGGGDEDRPKNATAEQTVIRWYGGAGASESEEVKTKVREVLWSAGLPQDIFVEPTASSGNTGSTYDLFRTWLTAGLESPDVFSMDSGWTIPFIERGQLQNLEELMDTKTISTVKNEFFGASVASTSGDDGTLYGIPWFPDFPTMQYRKDLVEEVGYDTDGWQTNPMSWKRFAEITADVMKQTGTKYGYTFQAANYAGLSCCNYNEWMTTWGGAYFGGVDNLFGPVGGRPVTVNKEGSVDALKMVRTFIHGEDDEYGMDISGNIAPTATLGWEEETSRKPFTNGHAVMHRNWPYAINISGVAEYLGEKLGVMPLPYGVKESNAPFSGIGGTASALGGWNSVINPNSTKKDAAVELLKALMTDEYMLWQFENLGFLPAKPALFNSDAARSVPVMGRYVDALRTAGKNAIPRPVTVAWPDQSPAIANTVNSALQKGSKKSPQQAMDELANTVEKIEDIS
ncbi:extracellular solute-binding protein [Halegenticoccus soli]|uniref:extracellular solute-binding protein n=1 Tax=Halegenticoccus soli TaxID=1985678 RepID=UPI000C6E49D3|nr:extracellular solute-binding protein [Halegenticoccus soli]